MVAPSKMSESAAAYADEVVAYQRRVWGDRGMCACSESTLHRMIADAFRSGFIRSLEVQAEQYRERKRAIEEGER